MDRETTQKYALKFTRGGNMKKEATKTTRTSEADVFVPNILLGDLGVTKMKEGEKISLQSKFTKEEQQVFKNSMAQYRSVLLQQTSGEAIDNFIEQFKKYAVETSKKYPNLEKELSSIPYNKATYTFREKTDETPYVPFRQEVGFDGSVNKVVDGNTLDLVLNTNFLEAIDNSKELNKKVVVGNETTKQPMFIEGIKRYEREYTPKEIIALSILRDLGTLTKSSMSKQHNTTKDETVEMLDANNKLIKVSNEIKQLEASKDKLTQQELEKLDKLNATLNNFDEKMKHFKELLPEQSNNSEFIYNAVAKQGVFAYAPDLYLGKNQLNKTSTSVEVIKKTPSALRFVPLNIIEISERGSILKSYGNERKVEANHKILEALITGVDNKIKNREEKIEELNAKGELSDKDKQLLEKYENEIEMQKTTLVVGKNYLNKVLELSHEEIEKQVELSRESNIEFQLGLYKQEFEKLAPQEEMVEELDEEAVEEKAVEQKEEIKEEKVEAVEEKAKKKTKAKTI